MFNARKIPRSLLFLFALALLFGALPINATHAQIEDQFVYLPIIIAPPRTCQPNANEQAIANLMKTDPLQGRAALNCDPILEEVARAHALDMGTRAFFGHTNPDGIGPNWRVEAAGYLLPSWYDQPLAANNVEAAAAGYSTPSNTWNQWMNSPAHKTHILGLNSFYAEQTDYGIGYVYVPGSPYGHYWVVITARH